MGATVLKCEQARQRVHDAIDQQRHDVKLEDHLTGCAKCREYAKHMRWIVADLEELREESEWLAASTKLPGCSQFDISRRAIAVQRILRPLGIAAVIALLATGWMYIESNSPDRHTVEVPRHRQLPIVARKLRAVSTEVVSPIGITLRGKSASTMLAVAQSNEIDRVRVYRLYHLFDRKTSED